jgi:flagellar assembly factor FliW
MKCAESNVIEPPTETKETVLRLPMGILGFEQVKNYVLLADPEEIPFAWLQMAEEPRLSFLVIPPTHALEGYNPDISQEEVDSLGLKDADDALVVNIVTLHRDGAATVNLKGPIVINRHTLVAKQVVPLNAAEFSLQHPLNLDSPTR